MALSGVPRALVRVALPVLLAVLAIRLAVGREPPVPQPVQFNHLKHTQELQLACDFCHKYVRTGAHAGLPGAETCSICHSSPQGTSEEASRVTELLADGDPLRFAKLFRLADHVFYTHRRHIEIGGLECANCHGAIAETTRPPPRPLIRVTMEFCIDCHRERGETVNCNACHR